MLKINYANSKKVETKSVKKSKEDLWYSTEDVSRSEQDDLNETLFRTNYSMMRQLESIQARF